MKQFLMGNEILAHAAIAAGAKLMTGYPITPTTEVLETWIKMADDNKLQYLQAEDECAAGFIANGAILGGQKAFTATSGPGHILMQDGLAMAEILRLPLVCLIGQRGGPSTGTVIYSQQEVTLACFGGNGEGLRLVYSASCLQDLYDYTIKAFNSAWEYRFPTTLLYDGYLGKMTGEVEFKNPPPATKSEHLLLGKNWRTCYNLEEELNELLTQYKQDWDKMAAKVIEYELVGNNDAETVVFAHGIVSAAVKIAISKLQKTGQNITLFRPITIRPFPQNAARDAIKQAKQIIIIESSFGQFSRIVKDQIYGATAPIKEVLKPAVGFTPEEIESLLLSSPI